MEGKDGATAQILDTKQMIRTKGQGGRGDNVYSWMNVNSKDMAEKTSGGGAMVEYYVSNAKRGNHGKHFGGDMVTWNEDTLPIHISAVHTGGEAGKFTTQIHDQQLHGHAIKQRQGLDNNKKK